MFKNCQVHQVLIALLLGFALGAWVIQLRDYGCWRQAVHHGPMRKHMIHKMEHDLKLDVSQKGQLEDIFKVMSVRMKTLREEMRPKFEALREETRAEIRKILRQEQMPKFEELNKKMDAKWAKYRAKQEAQG